MTTLIIDAQEHKVYSDTLISTDNNHTVTSKITGSPTTIKSWKQLNLGTYSKMYKHDEYIIIGCGDMVVLEDFNKKYPDDIPEPLSSSLILVLSKRYKGVAFIKFQTIKKTKSKFSWLSFKSEPEFEWKVTSTTTTERWLTYGSGSEYALGALLAGSTPTEAIQLTSTVDVSTGSEVVCMDIP